MFSKKKPTNKQHKKYKVSSTVHHTGTGQTDLMCKSVAWLLYNRQNFQCKGLIITSIISTYYLL